MKGWVVDLYSSKKRYKQKENITTESTKYKQAVTIATAVDLSQINITQGRGTDRQTDGRTGRSVAECPLPWGGSQQSRHLAGGASCKVIVSSDKVVICRSTDHIKLHSAQIRHAVYYSLRSSFRLLRDSSTFTNIFNTRSQETVLMCA